RSRWMNIDRAHLANIILPPIEVYKIGEAYFVKDGNHRVSVAREREQVFIDAEVIEIDTPVEINASSDIDQIIRSVEQAEFLKQTDLPSQRPEVNIEFTLPGGYQILLEHINVHRYFLGLRRQAEISWSEAVAHWIDQVYLPLLRVIDENRILNEFPGRTESDLYLWIIEHLWYLREENQQEVSLEAAAAHYTDEYSQRPLRRILHLVRKIAGFLAEEGEQEGPTDEDLDDDPHSGLYHFRV
ncbi:MAG: DUF4032 domain-containing protein, partial [Anaerolineaceae bacterium]|nr:DUF4032 domain-containing protein [Anaerolineaceae bacterium]